MRKSLERNSLAIFGISLCLVVLAGLVVPASIFKYSQAIAAGEPLTIVYHGELGKALALVLFASLAIVFLAAVLVAGRLQSRRDERWVLMISGVLVFLFVVVYPLGSRRPFQKHRRFKDSLGLSPEPAQNEQPARSDALSTGNGPQIRRAPAITGRCTTRFGTCRCCRRGLARAKSSRIQSV